MKTSLATFHDLKSAQSLDCCLLKVGISATVRDESKLQRFWFMTEPMAAIHVDVEQSDFLRARDVLGEWEKSAHSEKPVLHCPECGSSRVEYPQTTRKFVTPVVVAVLMLLRLVPRKYYCEDCHCTWRKEADFEGHVDALSPLRSRV